MVQSGILEKFIVRVNPAGYGYRTAHILIRTNNEITKDDVDEIFDERLDGISVPLPPPS